MVDIVSPNPKNPEPIDGAKESNFEPVQNLGQSSGGAGYYNGFDKPDSTRINLAGEGKGNTERIGNSEYDQLANQKLVGSVPPAKDFNNNENLSNLTPKEEIIPEQEAPKKIIKEEEPKDILEETGQPVGVNNPAGMDSQAAHFSPVSPIPTVVSNAPSKPKKSEAVDFKRFAIIFFGGLILAVILGLLSYYVSGLYYNSFLNNQKAELANIESQIDDFGNSPEPLTLPETTTTTSTTVPSATTTTRAPLTVPSTTTTTTIPPVPPTTEPKQQLG